MKRNWKQRFRTVLLVFASGLLGVNLYLWNARTLMGNSLPMPFGCGMAVVLSGSMEPTLQVDDMILVRAREEYHKDDIVVYQTGNMLVVHRIIEEQPDTVITQGDANNAPDAPVRREMIKGAVVACIPGVGGIARLLKSPAVSAALVAGALILSEMVLRKEKQKDEEELDRIKEEIRRLKEEQ